MELMQLEMLVAVVEEGSVHGAAKRVCRTAPAVSMALRKTEREIGTPLFDRSQRYAHRLTPAGEMLLGYARQLLSVRDELTTAVKNLNRSPSGQLRIGAIESINIYLLPILAQVFHERHPSVKIEVMCKYSDELLRELRNRELDLALLADLPEGKDWEAQLIMHDRMILIVSPQHPLAQREEIRMDELGTESIITEGNNSLHYGKITQAFNRSRTPLNVHIESATIETIKKMVAMKMGVGFVPLLCVREELKHGELVTVKVKGLSLKRTLWAVCRTSTENSPSLQSFMETVRQYSEQWQRGRGEPKKGCPKVVNEGLGSPSPQASRKGPKLTLVQGRAIRRVAG